MATDGKLAPAQHAVSGTYQDNSTHTLTKTTTERHTLATYIKRNWRQIPTDRPQVRQEREDTVVAEKKAWRC